MNNALIWASIITSSLALIGVAVGGWWTFHAADNASERTTEVAKEQAAVAGLATLTQEQRAELTQARQEAAQARQEAQEARQAAQEARFAAEDCHEGQARIEAQYTRLSGQHQDLLGYAVTLQMTVQRLGGAVPDPPTSLRPPL